MASTKIPNINGSTAVLLDAVKPVLTEKENYRSRDNSMLYDAITQSIFNKVDANSEYQKALLNKLADGILGRINSLLIQKENDGDLPSTSELSDLISGLLSSSGISSLDSDELAESIGSILKSSSSKSLSTLLSEITDIVSEKDESNEESEKSESEESGKSGESEGKSSIFNFVKKNMTSFFSNTTISNFQQMKADLAEIKTTTAAKLENIAPGLVNLSNTIGKIANVTQMIADGKFLETIKGAVLTPLLEAWDTFKAIGQTIFNIAKNVGTIAKGFAKLSWTIIRMSFQMAIMLVQMTIAAISIVSTIIGAIAGAIITIVTAISPILIAVAAGFALVMLLVWGFLEIQDWWNRMGGFEGIMTKMWDGIVDAASATWEWIKDFGGFLWDKLKEFGSFLYDTYIEPLVTMVKSVWNGSIKPLIEKAKEIWENTIKPFIDNAVAKVKEFVEMLKTKIWVPTFKIGQWNGISHIGEFISGCKIEKYYPFLDQTVPFGQAPTVAAVDSEFAVTPIAGPTIQAAQQLQDVQNIQNYNSNASLDNSEVTTGIDALADGNAETQDQLKKFQVSADEKLQTLINIVNDKQMGVMPVPMQTGSSDNQASKDN